MGNIVDHISQEEQEQWMVLVGIYVAVTAVLFLARQGYALIEQYLSFRVTYRLRELIAGKVLRVRSEALLDYATDDVMQMWNNDARELQTVSVQDIFNYVILTVSALMALIELWRISAYFPLIALTVNVLSLLPVHFIGRKNKQHSERLRESQVAMNEKFYTIFHCIRLVKSYGKEQEETEAFKRTNREYVEAKMGFFVSSRLYKSVVTSLNSIAPTILLFIANVQIRDGRLSIGDLVLATSLLATISLPFSEGGNFIICIKAIGFKFNHMFQFLELPEEQTTGRPVAGDGACDLVFDHVSYQAGGVRILDDISLTIRSGERVAVVGESGSGKTTLNNLMLRLYLPDEGTVFFGGADLQEYDLKSYRENIHYSQSNPYLAPDTVMGNLTLLGASKETCVQAAKAIRFHEEILAMPEGYDTVADPGGSNFSGGQKKKMAVIRALASDSRFYVLDEITRGMDEAYAEFLMHYLLDHLLATAVFTMHNFHAIERMDQIIVMQAGHVVAAGKHEELYQSCAYYRKLYNNRRRGAYES